MDGVSAIRCKTKSSCNTMDVGATHQGHNQQTQQHGPAVGQGRQGDSIRVLGHLAPISGGSRAQHFICMKLTTLSMRLLKENLVQHASHLMALL